MSISWPKLICKTLLLPLVLTLGACQSTTQSSTDIKALAAQYYAIYQARDDFEGLMAMYAEDAVLEDPVLGYRMVGKAEIKKFLDWPNPNFRKIDNQPTLVIQKQLIEGNKVVSEGYFPRFEWQGNALGPWRFVAWLEFNEQGKIIRHVDWINYTPKEKFVVGGGNLNDLIESDVTDKGSR